MSHVFTYEHKVINNSVTEVKYEIGRISLHYENRRQGRTEEYTYSQSWNPFVKPIPENVTPSDFGFRFCSVPRPILLLTLPYFTWSKIGRTIGHVSFYCFQVVQNSPNRIENFQFKCLLLSDKEISKHEIEGQNKSQSQYFVYLWCVYNG